MGMSLGGGSKGRPTPTVNVTPLVDVTLVILIIFMVVTPMMTKTFWLNIPEKPDPEDAKTKPVVEPETPLLMTVDSNGQIRVNETVLTRSEIATRLPRMMAAKKHKVLYFDAHDQLAYGAAVEIMDQSRSAGARSIAIVTKSVMH